MRPHRWKPTRLPHHPWDSPGKNTGVGCHFLLQCMKVKSESEVTQSCPTLSGPMDCSLPGSSVHGIFQARVLEWGAIAFSALPLHYLLYIYIHTIIHTHMLLYMNTHNYIYTHRYIYSHTVLCIYTLLHIYYIYTHYYIYNTHSELYLNKVLLQKPAPGTFWRSCSIS